LWLDFGKKGSKTPRNGMNNDEKPFRVVLKIHKTKANIHAREKERLQKSHKKLKVGRCAGLMGSRGFRNPRATKRERRRVVKKKTRIRISHAKEEHGNGTAKAKRKVEAESTIIVRIQGTEKFGQ